MELLPERRRCKCPALNVGWRNANTGITWFVQQTASKYAQAATAGSGLPKTQLATPLSRGKLKDVFKKLFIRPDVLAVGFYFGLKPYTFKDNLPVSYL